MAYTDIDDPTIFFNTILYSGTGSENARTGVGFQPDWVWIKQRNGATNQMLTDSVRGATKTLHSQNTDTESTDAQALKSFDSDGFTVGTDTDVNGASGTYVAWNWKAGGSASSNSNGSITSTVSVNTTAGFSIGTYSANATAGATVGHGLGVAPDWLIVKSRNADNNWGVFHKSLGATKAVYLDGTSAQYTDGWMNNTAPSSSVFTLSGGNYGNASGYTPVFYAFAEKKGYSKFGSYTGNGNADGVFIYTGFKPAWIMFKRTDGGSEQWNMYDNKRNTFNVVDKRLYADASDAEDTGSHMDFVSNGIKLKTSTGSLNGSGSTYIYMAFAESPFTNSNGVPTNAR